MTDTRCWSASICNCACSDACHEGNDCCGRGSRDVESVLSALQGLWKTLGAVPILIWYVATMPVVNGDGSSWQRDTSSFALFALIAGLLRTAYVASDVWVSIVEPKPASSCSVHGIFAFVGSLGSSNVARTFHAAVNVLCESVIFVIFCQDSRGSSGAGLVSRHFENHPQLSPRLTATTATGTASEVGTEYAVFASYVEQACALALLATFRAMGSLLGAPNGLKNRQPNHAGSSADIWAYLGYLDWGLSITSLVVCTALALSLLYNVGAASVQEGGAGDGASESHHQLVPERYVFAGSELQGGQRLLQWVLFLKLLFTYYVYDGDCDSCAHAQKNLASGGDIPAASSSQPRGHGTVGLAGRVIWACSQPLVKVLVACIGILLFQWNLWSLEELGHSKTAGVESMVQAAVNAPEYSVIRAWAHLSWFDKDRGALWVMVMRLGLQLWSALHAGRWFAVLLMLVTERLQGQMGLDLDGHHAADLDDLHFGAGAALVLAGSYSASGIMHRHGTEDTKLMQGRHSFALLQMVGGLTAALAGAMVLHWAVPWVRWVFLKLYSVYRRVFLCGRVVKDMVNDLATRKEGLVYGSSPEKGV